MRFIRNLSRRIISLAFLSFYFGQFFPGQFLQIIIRIPLDLYLLAGNDFDFVFVDHLGFDLHIRVVAAG